jgi:mRNA-degrading endonuclease RelE of RelBE toxin-antitoxin system
MLPDEDYRGLQEALLRRPEQGVIIKESGGVRKLRWGETGRGKRGALRVIYYWYSAREVFLMLYAYRKSEQKDLTAAQVKALAQAVRREFK